MKPTSKIVFIMLFSLSWTQVISSLSDYHLSCSVHITICWLLQAFVCLHGLLELDENILHGSCWTIPIVQSCNLWEVYQSILLINSWNVDLRSELYCWWTSWIIISTCDSKEVDTSIECCVWWSYDSSIPSGEWLIITCIKSIWNRLIRKLSLLCLL